MMTVNDAVRLVLLATTTDGNNNRHHMNQCVRLAMQWPSLAAALADLLAAHEMPVPAAFRAARSAMREEAAQPAAQPRENGAWCLCSGGPNADGRGHLRGETGCGAGG